jgi:hypothetical protein
MCVFVFVCVYGLIRVTALARHVLLTDGGQTGMAASLKQFAAKSTATPLPVSTDKVFVCLKSFACIYGTHTALHRRYPPIL